VPDGNLRLESNRASIKWQRGKDTSMASAGNKHGWRVGREHSQNALEIVLLHRTYVLPWAQFIYAEGGEDEVRLIFATHDVLARGTGLQALLADLAARRLVGLDEPTSRSGLEPYKSNRGSAALIPKSPT
jgi:hypothetical protein